MIFPNRLYNLDVSRGIASLAVVLWHWKHFAYTNYSLPRNFDSTTQPLYSILKIFYEGGNLGVQYFFLLSGFIFFWLYSRSIEMRITTVRIFFIHRFSRLYPLHFLTLILVALLQFVYSSKNQNYFIYQYNDIYHFILQLFFISQWNLQEGHSFNGPIWSVSIEILLYILFFIVSLYQLSKPFFCLIISVFSYFLLYLFSNAIFEGIALFFFGGFVYFGINFFEQTSTKMKNLVFYLTIICWIAVIVNFYVYNYTISLSQIGLAGKVFLKSFPVYILFPLTLLSLVFMEIDKGYSFRKISIIGDITYSTYLLHFPLQLVFAYLASCGIFGTNFYLNYNFLILFYLTLILLSIITYNGFERPIQKMIRKKLGS